MPSNEEGEFELVLGNKQLLSVFFIVVLLLGVFFAMGYIVGRNTTPAPTQVASAVPPPGPLVVEPPGGSPSKPSPVGTAPDPEPSNPGVIPPAKTEPPKAESPKSEPPKPEPVKAPPPKAEPEPPPPAPGALRAGTYLQVAATRQDDAKLLADVLGKKGFPTATQAVPDSPLVRVLVGPLADAGAVSKTRSDLEAAGFKSFVRRI